MHESIELFEKVITSKYFKTNHSILLCLTKKDIFKKQLHQQVSLSCCFSKNAGWNGKQWNGTDYKLKNKPDKDMVHLNKCYDEAIKFIWDIFFESKSSKSTTYNPLMRATINSIDQADIKFSFLYIPCYLHIKINIMNMMNI